MFAGAFNALERARNVLALNDILTVEAIILGFAALDATEDAINKLDHILDGVHTNPFYL